MVLNFPESLLEGGTGFRFTMERAEAEAPE